MPPIAEPALGQQVGHAVQEGLDSVLYVLWKFFLGIPLSLPLTDSTYTTWPPAAPIAPAAGALPVA